MIISAFFEDISDIIDTILEYWNNLDFGIEFDISDGYKRLIKYVMYIFKVCLAIYMFYTTIPRIRTYGIRYQSNTNGILKLIKATAKLIFGITMIYLMLFPRKKKCPPCPICPKCSNETSVVE